MRAAVMVEVGRVVIDEVEIDGPREGELLVDVAACGLCHSDVHKVDGAFGASVPAVVGHEVSGIVADIGRRVDGFEPGDHVVLTLSQFCADCEACDRGDTWLCKRRESPPLVRGEEGPPRLTMAGTPVGQFLHIGGLAEQVVVHQNAAVRVERPIPHDVAALLGCGVLTGVATVTNVAGVGPGESVVVIGCGGVGLSAVQGARIAGASTIIGVDVSEEALALASELGATHTLIGGGPDIIRTVRGVTDGGADHVFEAIGLETTMVFAPEMVRPGGTAYLIGLSPIGTKIEIDAFKLVWFTRGVQGVLMGANRFRHDIPVLADLTAGGSLDVDRMITNRISLDEAPAALEAMREGAVGRTVVMLR
jgi:S-(hydroxymethyl)glutathione dehydrogenase/alcohol dehydrogenase